MISDRGAFNFHSTRISTPSSPSPGHIYFIYEPGAVNNSPLIPQKEKYVPWTREASSISMTQFLRVIFPLFHRSSMRVDATGPSGGCLLAIRRSPRNRISIGTVITGLRFGFVVILNDLFAHGHLLHPPLRQQESFAIIIMANSRNQPWPPSFFHPHVL